MLLRDVQKISNSELLFHVQMPSSCYAVDNVRAYVILEPSRLASIPHKISVLCANILTEMCKF